MRTRFCALFLGILMVAGGCSGMVTSPSNPGLRVTVQAAPTLVGGADTATFTLKVENTGATAVDLTFPSSCQVLPYFTARSTGHPVTPVGTPSTLGSRTALTASSRTLLRSR